MTSIKRLSALLLTLLMILPVIISGNKTLAAAAGTVRVEDYPGNGGGNYQAYGAFLTDDPHFTGGIYYEGLYTLQSGHSISNPTEAIEQSWALCIRRNTSSGGNTQSINLSVYNGYGQYPVYVKAEDSPMKQETLNGLYYIISNGYPYETNGMNKYDAAAASDLAVSWFMHDQAIKYSYGFPYDGNYSSTYEFGSGHISMRSGHEKAWETAVSLYQGALSYDPEKDDPHLSANLSSQSVSDGILKLNYDVTLKNLSSYSLSAESESFLRTNGISWVIDSQRFILEIPLDKSALFIEKDITFDGFTDRSLGHISFIEAKDNSCQTVLTVNGSYDIKVEDSGSIIVDLKGNLAITKTIACDLELTRLAGSRYYSLAGARFEVFNSKNESVGILETDENGKTGVLEGLSCGIYTVREITAPKGFRITEPDSQTVTVLSDKTATVSFADEPEFDPVSVLLTKTGNKQEKIAGARFTISYYNTDLADAASAKGLSAVRQWVFETKTNGRISYHEDYLVSGDELFKDEIGGYVLLPGTYVVEETSVPEHYLKAETFLIKVQPGSDAVYYDASGHGMLAADADEGYKLTEYHDGLVQLKKSSSDKEFQASLSGAEYIIWLDEACSRQALDTSGNKAVLITDDNGISNTVSLVPGTYYIKESKAPKGYQMNSEVFTVTVREYETAVIDTADNPSRGRIRIVKEADEDYSSLYPVSGAVYGVYLHKEGNTLSQKVGELTVDNDGNSDYLTVNIGTYYVREIKAPEGYKINEEIQTVAVGEDKTVIVYSREEATMGWLQLRKTSVHADAEYLKQYPLTGTTYGVFSDRECTIHVKDSAGHPMVLTVQDDGTTEKADIPAGTYYLKELKAAKGYLLSEEVILAEVNPGSTCIVSAQNREEFGYLKIKKTVANDPQDEYLKKNGLHNISFRVYLDGECSKAAKAFDDSGSQQEAVLQIDDHGDSNLLKLQAGTYYLREINCGSEYRLSDKILRINVNETETLEISWENQPDLTEVSVRKLVGSEDDLIRLAPDFYHLVGTQFTVYQDMDCTVIAQKYDPVTHRCDGGDAVISIIDEEGNSDTVTLPSGTYYLRETKVNEGFIRNDTIVSFTVDQSLEKGIQTYTVEFSNTPKTNPDAVLIVKSDSEGTPIKGAVFKVTYYPAILSNVEEALVSSGSRTWHFVTDASGMIRYQQEYIAEDYYDPFAEKTVELTSDGLFTRDDGTEVLIPGTYLYQEVYAPNEKQTGYSAVDPFISVFPVEALSESRDENRYQSNVITDGLQHISIILQKKDAETGKSEPQGYGSLEKAEYEVIFYDPIKNTRKKVGTIITNEKGYGELIQDESGDILLPGTYYITETKAPQGYLVNAETWTLHAAVSSLNTALFTYHIEDIDQEKVTRIMISKKTFNERGEYYPCSGSVLALYDGDQQLESWICDGTGHLIKGLTVGKTYIIKELESGSGTLLCHETVEFTVQDTEEIQQIEFINDPEVDIGTVARFSDGSKVHLAEGEITVTDLVDMKGLHPGKLYLLKAKLVDRQGNVIAEGTRTFIASDYSETQEVILDELDVAAQQGSVLTVYETLYRWLADSEEYEEIASHCDNDDLQQTIWLPQISTSAHGSGTDEHFIANTENQTVYDTVSYKGLMPDQQYLLKTSLMDRESGNVITDSEGKSLVKEMTFTAEKADGTIDVSLLVDGNMLAGKSLVFCEEIYLDGKLIGQHRDLNDENQMIHVPLIATAAALESSNGDQYVISDTIHYENLKESETYVITGWLADTASGEKLKDETGKEIAVQQQFVCQNGSGDLVMEIAVDKKTVVGKTLTVCQMITSENRKVAVHDDINNEKQQVVFPKTDVKVKKTDENGKPLSGALIQLINEKGEVIEEFTSTSEEHDISTLVSYGETYTLHEVKAPYGYVPAEDVEFTVTGTEEDPQINEIINLIMRRNVVIRKIDAESGELLHGAQMQLIDSQGTIIGEWITTKDSYVAENLTVNETYTLREISAPEGYRKAEDISFTVSEQDHQVITMTDILVEIPSTGDSNSLYLWYCLLVSAMAIILTVAARIRRGTEK